MMPPPIVRLAGVAMTYAVGDGHFTALHPLDMVIPAGRTVALLGRSGSGKSTLLNLLGGVDRPTAGTVHVAGDDLTAMSQGQLALFRRRKLGFVFQSFHLLPSLTAFDNVAVPFSLDRKLDKDNKRRVQDLLVRLGVGDKADSYPDQLSGGQQQRIAIARAVVHRPAVVLADEPTGNLDVKTGRVILDLLSELQQELGVTVVMATHSEEAAETCQDRVVLEDGRVIESTLA